jgi:hypothetical protein
MSKPSSVVVEHIAKPSLDAVDLEKRYDIYVHEVAPHLVVYRNARFCGMKGLAQRGRLDFGSEFIEIQQANDQKLFLRRHSVVKFCEPGTTLTMEQLQPK